MPAITEARREARRGQILEAARACLLEHGLEAVSMEMIVARSGLSTGAVYGYFRGKEEIIGAVVTEGTAELAEMLVPVLRNPDPPAPPVLLEQVLRTVVEFGPHERGVDRMLVAVHGWSHSQSDPGLKAATRKAYRKLRRAYCETAARWQAAGALDRGVEPADVAELLTSLTLGFVAQRTLAGDADLDAHVRACASLLGTARTGPTSRNGRATARRRS